MLRKLALLLSPAEVEGGTATVDKTTTTTTADKTTEKPTPPTPQQQKGMDRFLKTFMTGEAPPPEKPETKEEKAAREKKEADDKAELEKKGKTTPPKPKPKPVARKPEKPLTGEEIAEAAARGVATALKPADKPDDKTTTTVTEPEFSDTEKRRISVLERMEKLYPEKYKGIADRYKKGVKSLNEYADKWESEHPGEEFKDDGEEHADFFKKNEVDWEDDDYTEALADIKTDTKVAAANKETNEKLSKFERAEKLREAAPKIAAATHKPAAQFWNAQGDDFKGLVDENGQLNQEKALEFQKSDPVTFGIRVTAATALDNEVQSLYAIMNGLLDYNPENHTHRAISDFAGKKEVELAAKPQDERLDGEGRDFLPAAKYYKLPKAKREDYWTFSFQDLAALRSSSLAEWASQKVKEEEDKFNKMAAARGFKKGESTQQPEKKAETEEEEVAVTTDGKPVTPSASGESRLAASKKEASKGAEDPLKTFYSRQLGK